MKIWETFMPRSHRELQRARFYLGGAARVAVNCYEKNNKKEPDLLWDRDMYARLDLADAWAIIGPVNSYVPTSNLKLMFHQRVCMNGGNQCEDTIKPSACAATIRKNDAMHNDTSTGCLTGPNNFGATAKWKCSLDFGTQNSSFIRRYACPTRNFQ